MPVDLHYHDCWSSLPKGEQDSMIKGPPDSVYGTPVHYHVIVAER